MKKFRFLILLLVLFSCQKDDIYFVDSIVEDKDIFAVESSVIRNGHELDLSVNQSGDFLLSITDEFTGQTFTNEKFRAEMGSNKINIYTRVLPKGSYKLEVKDSRNNIINQTTIRL